MTWLSQRSPNNCIYQGQAVAAPLAGCRRAVGASLGPTHHWCMTARLMGYCACWGWRLHYSEAQGVAQSFRCIVVQLWCRVDFSHPRAGKGRPLAEFILGAEFWVGSVKNQDSDESEFFCFRWKLLQLMRCGPVMRRRHFDVLCVPARILIEWSVMLCLLITICYGLLRCVMLYPCSCWVEGWTPWYLYDAETVLDAMKWQLSQSSVHPTTAYSKGNAPLAGCRRAVGASLGPTHHWCMTARLMGYCACWGWRLHYSEAQGVLSLVLSSELVEEKMKKVGQDGIWVVLFPVKTPATHAVWTCDAEKALRCVVCAQGFGWLGFW